MGAEGRGKREKRGETEKRRAVGFHRHGTLLLALLLALLVLNKTSLPLSLLPLLALCEPANFLVPPLSKFGHKHSRHVGAKICLSLGTKKSASLFHLSSLSSHALRSVSCSLSLLSLSRSPLSFVPLSRALLFPPSPAPSHSPSLSPYRFTPLAIPLSGMTVSVGFFCLYRSVLPLY